MKTYRRIIITLAALLLASHVSANLYAAEKKSVDPRKIMALYKRHCALCHGKDGKGMTKGGQKAGAKDYSDPKVAAKLKDQKKVVKSILDGMKDEKGKMLMAPFKRKLKPQEALGLIKFMQTFSKPKKK